MDNTIKHEGIVERIENGIAYVKIIQHSACQSSLYDSRSTRKNY